MQRTQFLSAKGTVTNGRVTLLNTRKETQWTNLTDFIYWFSMTKFNNFMAKFNDFNFNFTMNRRYSQNLYYTKKLFSWKMNGKIFILVWRICLLSHREQKSVWHIHRHVEQVTLASCDVECSLCRLLWLHSLYVNVCSDHCIVLVREYLIVVSVYVCGTTFSAAAFYSTHNDCRRWLSCPRYLSLLHTYTTVNCSTYGDERTECVHQHLR